MLTMRTSKPFADRALPGDEQTGNFAQAHDETMAPYRKLPVGSFEALETTIAPDHDLEEVFIVRSARFGDLAFFPEVVGQSLGTLLPQVVREVQPALKESLQHLEIGD
jgi:hypothetical protein